jgi:hypothetical protein
VNCRTSLGLWRISVGKELAKPFAYFLPISLQTDAKTYKQTLEVFVAGWIVSVLETER